MTIAYGGEIGRQDLAGIGARRALRTRGDLHTVSRGESWRIADVSILGNPKGIPADIVSRLRAHAERRKCGTGNDSPNDTLWTEPRAYVTLDRAAWMRQKWHVVTLPDTAGLRCEHGKPTESGKGCGTCRAVAHRARVEAATK